ncbi:alpha/beta hydrolase [Chitinophaga sp. MM2321]|uniref:alpha/beta fold hydrolase n=1 Tax=Chitinophaga sp. MM2321 TaxID=3137178 RepID=UPI0032D5783C
MTRFSVLFWLMKNRNINALGGMLGLLALFTMAGNAYAQPLTDKKTDTIHSLEKVTLGGIKQTILITGSDTINNPILLLLHGGPGFSELRFFRSYNTALDSGFTVVNWDQRGTGLSYDPKIPVSSMTLDQLIEDTHQLIGILKKKFSKQKIFLVGHSWGSLLGISVAQRYPEDIQAYVGVGQVVSMRESEKIGLAYAIKMAEKEHNTKALLELRPLTARYPSTGTSGLNDLFVQRKWLMYFGGVVHGKRNYNDIFKGITAGENKLYNDSLNAEGEMFSINALWPSLLNADLFKSIPKLTVPVFFITGRFDYNTNAKLIARYFNFLSAPHKELIWFENSAHIMPFEEPEKFNEVMKEVKNSEYMKQ